MFGKIRNNLYRFPAKLSGSLNSCSIQNFKISARCLTSIHNTLIVWVYFNGCPKLIDSACPWNSFRPWMSFVTSVLRYSTQRNWRSIKCVFRNEYSLLLSNNSQYFSGYPGRLCGPNFAQTLREWWIETAGNPQRVGWFRSNWFVPPQLLAVGKLSISVNWRMSWESVDCASGSSQSQLLHIYICNCVCKQFTQNRWPQFVFRKLAGSKNRKSPQMPHSTFILWTKNIEKGNGKSLGLLRSHAQLNLCERFYRLDFHCDLRDTHVV